jgi:hypothetical protein
MTDKFSEEMKIIAREMAISVNGGDWDKDYTETQKIGWYLKAQWVFENCEYINEQIPDFKRSDKRNG